jgi:hypothetical protein
LIRCDEIRQRGLHFVESIRRLHQVAELCDAGKISRTCHQVRKDHRGLSKALGEEEELLLPLHNRDPIFDDQAKAAGMALAFGRFAMERCDLLGILARAHQVETEIGLEPLLIKIKWDQKPPNQMRQHGANYRINKSRPDQIAGNGEVDAE